MAEQASGLVLVDLETVMRRKATVTRRARDVVRFVENFIEPEDYRQNIEYALQEYARDDSALAQRILATRRVQRLLSKRGVRKRDLVDA